MKLLGRANNCILGQVAILKRKQLYHGISALELLQLKGLVRSVDCFRLGWPMRADADFFKTPKDAYSLCSIASVVELFKLDVKTTSIYILVLKSSPFTQLNNTL